MDLIEDRLNEDVGECRGRGLCGTCHVFHDSSELLEKPSSQETRTIDDLVDREFNSRLACQIILDERIHNAVFKVSDCN